MKANMLRFALSAFCVFAAQLPAQQPTQQPEGPSYYQTSTYIKVAPGKSTEWLELVRNTSMKVAQMRADAGEITVWTLLRSVMPSGQEARADYAIHEVTVGAPREPSSMTTALQKAGVTMSSAELSSKRNSLSTLVAVELWRPRVRLGAAKKGHYLYVNHMKVHDAAAFHEFELNIQRPMFEERIKRGEMSGWNYSTKLLPAGTDTPYTARTADIYPSWEAAFKAMSSGRELFARVHPDKKIDEVMGNMSKMRDHAKRELWVVVERVEKKK
jgi:hypothetical protein